MPAPWYARDRTALGLLAFFAAVYGTISFVNHAQLRTFALDLGLYTHALWQYAHGRLADSGLFLGTGQPLLADHFDLYLVVLSPLVHLFGTWTLLLVQWVAMLLGGWGLRRFLLLIGVPAGAALTGMVTFLLFFGMFAAVAFDYHSNVVAAMLLPWFLGALWQGRRMTMLLLFITMLAGKENMGLWLGPLALVLAFGPGAPRHMKRFSAGLAALGLMWSLVVIGVVMPALSADGAYAHFDYKVLGMGLRDVPSALLQRPWDIARAFFIDHVGTRDGTAIKLEFWWMMLAAGGWALVLRPRWGLMALPLLAQKMLHDDPGKWGVVAHYGVEFAPLIAVAVGLVLARCAPGRMRTIVTAVLLTASLGTLVRFMDNTVAYHQRSRIRIYQAEHYRSPHDVAEVRRALETVPPKAVVSAQSPLVPHLALRDGLHQYPILGDATYLVLLPGDSPYPLDTAVYVHRLDTLRTSAAWERMPTGGSVELFRRKDVERPLR